MLAASGEAKSLTDLVSMVKVTKKAPIPIIGNLNLVGDYVLTKNILHKVSSSNKLFLGTKGSRKYLTYLEGKDMKYLSGLFPLDSNSYSFDDSFHNYILTFNGNKVSIVKLGSKRRRGGKK